MSSGLGWPLKRITVNLAPSGLRKGGSGLDLAIAVGVLAADGQLEASAVERSLVPRRARARRQPSAGARHGAPLRGDAERWARRAARLCGRSRCRSPRSGSGRRDARRARAGAARARAVARPSGAAPGDELRARARPPRRAGARARSPCGRGRGRGRASPLDGGPARVGQDDARDEAREPLAAARPERRARGHDRALGRRRRAAARRSRLAPSVPSSSPQLVDGLARRRGRRGHASGRDEPRESRRAVLGRARRVHRAGARRPPSAARRGRRAGEPRKGERRVPCEGAARRRDEPLSVRRGRSSGRVPVQRGVAAPLHPPRLRPARRSIRPAGADHATERRRAHGAAGRGVLGDGRGEGRGRRARSPGPAASRRTPRSTGRGSTSSHP